MLVCGLWFGLKLQFGISGVGLRGDSFVVCAVTVQSRSPFLDLTPRLERNLAGSLCSSQRRGARWGLNEGWEACAGLVAQGAGRLPWLSQRSLSSSWTSPAPLHQGPPNALGSRVALGESSGQVVISLASSTLEPEHDCGSRLVPGPAEADAGEGGGDPLSQQVSSQAPASWKT